MMKIWGKRVRKQSMLGSGHVTPADGNIFLDLGFEPEEAARLQEESRMKIAQRGEFARVHTPEDIAAYKARQQSRSDGHGQD